MMSRKNHHQQLNMNSEMKSALILPAKYPEVGNVKTRLAKRIGFEEATEYDRAWLENSLLQAAELPASIDVFIRLARLQDLNKMKALVEDLDLSSRIRCMLPTADNITDNLRDAFLELLPDYKKVVSFATDIPSTTTKLLLEPFKALDGNDIVIGVDRERRGINAFGILRNRASAKLIGQLFSQNTQGLNPYEWTMQVVNSQKTKPRRYIITQIIDVDTLSDLIATGRLK